MSDIGGVRFNETSAFEDGGVLLEVDRDTITEGNDGAERVSYFALPCKHGEWLLVERDSIKHFDKYACANGCGALLKVRTKSNS